jgi:hypothetical protein
MQVYDDCISKEHVERAMRRGIATSVAEVECIAGCCPQLGLQVLIASIFSVNREVSDAALTALKAIGEPAYCALTDSALQCKGSDQVAALKALARWGDPRGIETIVQAAGADRRDATIKKVGAVTLMSICAAAIVAIVVGLGGFIDPLAWMFSGGLKKRNGSRRTEIKNSRYWESVTYRPGDLQYAAVCLLSEFSGTQAAGALAEFVGARSADASRAADEALNALLTREDVMHSTGLLNFGNNGSRKLMIAAELGSRHLRLNILRAVRCSGDESILPALKTIAENPKDSPYARRYATEAIVQIGVNAQNLQLRATLLRSSSGSSAIDPSTLLRPGITDGAIDPAEMLRPAPFSGGSDA